MGFVKARACTAQENKKNDSLQTKAKDKSTTPYMFEAVNDLPIIFVHHHR
jgi:hypothetical protein